jgi:hypothetical protein
VITSVRISLCLIFAWWAVRLPKNNLDARIPRDPSEKTPRKYDIKTNSESSAAKSMRYNTNIMSLGTRVSKLKSRLKRHERKKQRLSTTNGAISLTKDDVRAGDKTYPSHVNYKNGRGPRYIYIKPDRDRRKEPHRPNERKKFYFRMFFHLYDFAFLIMLQMTT